MGAVAIVRRQAGCCGAAVPGQYRLRLITHGYGTPNADLYTFMKSVTVE